MMDEEKLSFEKISEVYQKEKKSALLTKIAHNFYDKALNYIAELEKKYETEEKTKPTSTKTLLLGEELRKIRAICQEVYEHRTRKLTLLALNASSGGKVDLSLLIDNEKKLFDSILRELNLAKKDIWGYEKKESKEEYKVVCILRDIPEFAGEDCVYRLSKKDFVSLPVTIANILCDRGLAKPINSD